MENVAMADIQTRLNTLCYWINISETRGSLRKTITWHRMRGTEIRND
jgi:hypothetical protein